MCAVQPVFWSVTGGTGMSCRVPAAHPTLSRGCRGSPCPSQLLRDRFVRHRRSLLESWVHRQQWGPCPAPGAGPWPLSMTCGADVRRVRGSAGRRGLSVLG